MSVNEEVLETLRRVLENQRRLQERLSTVEREFKENYDLCRHNSADGDHMDAQNELLRECKVGIKKLQRSIRRISRKIDKVMKDDKISLRLLPPPTLNAVGENKQSLRI